MKLRWDVIGLLIIIGLIRPILSIAHAYDRVGRPFGPLLVTALLAIVWVGIVVIARIPYPLITLIAAGIGYRLGAILLQQAIWRIFLDAPPAEAPTGLPILLISWIGIIVTNLIWGAFLGLIALVLQQWRTNTMRQRMPTL